jgi:hypothetical protein
MEHWRQAFSGPSVKIKHLGIALMLFQIRLEHFRITHDLGRGFFKTSEVA